MSSQAGPENCSLEEEMQAQEMGSCWRELCKGSNVEQSVDTKWLQTVCTRYREKHRHYHTLSHVTDILRQIDQMAAQKLCVAGDVQVLKWSAIFHDLVYDPRRADSERESASAWAEFAEEARLCGEVRNRVQSCILATEGHKADASDPLQAVFLDLDLSILGSDPSTYSEYARNIRAEYAHMPEREFCRGRREVLQRLLLCGGGTLFTSGALGPEMEETAKQNLRAEIAVLERAEGEWEAKMELSL